MKLSKGAFRSTLAFNKDLALELFSNYVLCCELISLIHCRLNLMCTFSSISPTPVACGLKIQLNKRSLSRYNIWDLDSIFIVYLKWWVHQLILYYSRCATVRGCHNLELSLHKFQCFVQLYNISYISYWLWVIVCRLMDKKCTFTFLNNFTTQQKCVDHW